MRRCIQAAASAAIALAFAVGATNAQTPSAPAHKMPGMDHSMKMADAADDKATAETPDGFMFHTFHGKTESVHLPAAGGVWSATPSDPALVEVGAGRDAKMPDGMTHHVVKVTTKAAGNASIKFERRASADKTGAVLETRVVKFMIH